MNELVAIQAVRFLRYWRGRTPGSVDAGLTPGVAAVLVHRRIADWCPADALSQPAAEGSPSVATVLAPPESRVAPVAERKKKR